jgi:anti-sigma regulatory factor (Ser/Thr protein kinase)
MHPYAITGPPAPMRPDAAPGLTALPARSERTRPGPARQDTSCMLGPRDTAPGDARATVRLTLATWGLAHASDLAEMVISELVTNAIAASRASAPAGTDPRPITYRLTADGRELRIEVWDPDPAPPPQQAALPGDDDESGRGLFIVAALSSGWGTYSCNGGKVVWSSLSLAIPPPGEPPEPGDTATQAGPTAGSPPDAR